MIKQFFCPSLIYTALGADKDKFQQSKYDQLVQDQKIKTHIDQYTQFELQDNQDVPEVKPLTHVEAKPQFEPEDDSDIFSFFDVQKNPIWGYLNDRGLIEKLFKRVDQQAKDYLKQMEMYLEGYKNTLKSDLMRDFSVLRSLKNAKLLNSQQNCQEDLNFDQNILDQASLIMFQLNKKIENFLIPKELNQEEVLCTKKLKKQTKQLVKQNNHYVNVSNKKFIHQISQIQDDFQHQKVVTQDHESLKQESIINDNMKDQMNLFTTPKDLNKSQFSLMYIDEMDQTVKKSKLCESQIIEEYTCSFCLQKSASSAIQKQHQKNFHNQCKNGKITCRICQRDFQIIDHLDEHYSKYHPKSPYFICACRKQFLDQLKLEGHQQRCEILEKYK